MRGLINGFRVVCVNETRTYAKKPMTSKSKIGKRTVMVKVPAGWFQPVKIGGILIDKVNMIIYAHPVDYEKISRL